MTKNSDVVLDTVETLIAHLLCSNQASQLVGERDILRTNSGLGLVETEVSDILRFEPMAPNHSYTTQLGKNDRVYVADAGYLVHTVQDLIGNQSEVALVDEQMQCVKWLGFRKVAKAPRGVWVSSPGASIYEIHHRIIQPTGESIYAKRIAAISKTGKPVQCILGGQRLGGGTEAHQVIIAASTIEDAHRQNAVLATIRESAAIMFPIVEGEHKKVFALRDGPNTPGGRRKAILHWVSQHLRTAPVSGDQVSVKEHMRGVSEFEIEGLHVKLESNRSTDTDVRSTRPRG